MGWSISTEVRGVHRSCGFGECLRLAWLLAQATVDHAREFPDEAIERPKDARIGEGRLHVEYIVHRGEWLLLVTNVTTTNPQVVRVEWSVNKQWSLVLLRDENGTFGADVYFKRRF